ncbi:MAG: hemerythrin domain-containing protein [SAR324 cluster bacterium]|nr:hemerythrin domain-containing protein [SAR324 cluster bacterium]
MVELSKSFELEIETLDNDHKELVTMANEISALLDQGNSGDCKDRLAQFIRFAKAHFSREERLLLKVGYPNVEKHHRHHKELDLKMEHMLEFAESAGLNEQARESLKKELVFFIMDDVITTDLDFKDFVKSKKTE